MRRPARVVEPCGAVRAAGLASLETTLTFDAIHADLDRVEA